MEGTEDSPDAMPEASRSRGARPYVIIDHPAGETEVDEISLSQESIALNHAHSQQHDRVSPTGQHSIGDSAWQQPPPASPSPLTGSTSPPRHRPATPPKRSVAQLRLEDDVRPSVDVREELHPPPENGTFPPPGRHHTAYDRYVIDLDHGAAHQATTPSGASDVVIAGRVGHASCINGEYIKLDGVLHDGKQVFRHRDPIPPGFMENSGLHLHLAYYESNDAWAIATQLGSLDVVAYTLGDVLNATHVVMMGRPLWYISSGEGHYDADENVVMCGRYVPEPRMELYKEALSLPDHDTSYEEDVLGDLPEQEEEEAEAVEEEAQGTVGGVGGERARRLREESPQQRPHSAHLPDRPRSPLMASDSLQRDGHGAKQRPSKLSQEETELSEGEAHADMNGRHTWHSSPSSASARLASTKEAPPRDADQSSSVTTTRDRVSGAGATGAGTAPTPSSRHADCQQQELQEEGEEGKEEEEPAREDDGGGGGVAMASQQMSQMTTQGRDFNAAAEEAHLPGHQGDDQDDNRPQTAGTDGSKGQGSTALATAASGHGDVLQTREQARAELSSAYEAQQQKRQQQRQQRLGFERSWSVGARAGQRLRDRHQNRRTSSVSDVTAGGKRTRSRERSSSSSSQNTDRSGSLRRFGSRLSKSIKRFPGSRKMRQTLSDTKLRLQRLSGKETPCEALLRHVKKFRAAQSDHDRMLAVEDMRKTLQRSRSRRDELPELRSALLDAWRCCIGALPSAPADQWEPYFDVLLNVMTRDEVQIFRVTQHDIDSPRASWVKGTCRLIWQTHSFVIEKLSSVISQENLLLFCAKALAVNYFLVPDLAQVIVTSVTRATPISSRRSRKIGSLLYNNGLMWLTALERYIPRDSKNVFYNIYQLCGVDVTATSDQHPGTCPRVPLFHEHAILTTHSTYHRIMQGLQLETTPDLLDEPLWLGHRASPGSWTARFVTETEAGFGFLAVFLEVLVRRAKSLYRLDYFDSKADQQLGINRKSVFALTYCPGFLELGACYLRLALTTRHAIKWSIPCVVTPTNLICNWSDRTAACALAMSVSGVFFSALFQDLMLQTSTTHVADVISLLASFQAFLKCYHHMHSAPLPADVDIALFLDFLLRLTSCNHYVVTLFALRWTYECIDYFCTEHRARITHFLTTRSVLEPLLCHWESNVRHLIHTLLLFRLFPPSQQDLLLGFVQCIQAQVEHPQLAPDSYQPLSPALIAHAGASPAVASLYREQVGNVQELLQEIIEENRCAGGLPYSVLSRPTPHRATALQSVYAVETLNQLATTAVDAGKWFKETRHRSSDERAFPSITMAMPPLQNMTSMYSRAKTARF